MANKSNATLRVVMHGFFLTSNNLFSGATAFLILHLARLKPGFEAVSVFSMLFCIGVYTAIYYLMKRIQPEIMKIDSVSMGIFIFLFSLLLQPALIHPLMAMVRGGGYSSPIPYIELLLPVIINSSCLLLNRFFFTDSPTS